MRQSLEKLKRLAYKMAELDEQVLEVFIHSETPKDPLKNDEIYLVCHLADPRIKNDLQIYNDEGFSWSLHMQESIQPFLSKLNIEPEIVISAFNFALHEENEYGQYYNTLYIRDGFEPILKVADQQKKERERQMIEEMNKNN